MRDVGKLQKCSARASLISAIVTTLVLIGKFDLTLYLLMDSGWKQETWDGLLYPSRGYRLYYANKKCNAFYGDRFSLSKL